MGEYSVVGKSVERTDGRVKVTGTARFAGDLIAPGMLHGKFLRSPHAHAKILNIDTSKAERFPGVMAVITGAEFPGEPFGTRPDTRDQLPMPITKVHHFGEGVAAVAAWDEDTAEEALDLIEVEYEELPVVLTAEDALKPDAPQVNEFKKSNLAYSSDFVFGDVGRGQTCGSVIRHHLFEQRGHPFRVFDLFGIARDADVIKCPSESGGVFVFVDGKNLCELGTGAGIDDRG